MNSKFSNILLLGPNREKINWRKINWISVLIFFAISIILAGRVLYIAPDDQNYISYFEGYSGSIVTNVWLYFLSEPLWTSYARFVGNLFGPEMGLRLTIFFSSFIFLIASNKLARGAWIFVFLVFVLDYSLAPLMYYIQIRQGLALSVFLIIVATGFNPILGAIVASTIHSSFIVVIPCAIVAGVWIRSKIWIWAIFFSIAILVLYLNKTMGDIDLGRRSENYDLKNATNIFYYLTYFIQFGVAFYFLYNKQATEQERSWYRFSLIFFSFSICLTFVHEAATRLLFFADVFVMILLGANIRKRRAKIGALIWLLMLFLIMMNQNIKGGFGPETWYGRWKEILLWVTPSMVPSW